MVLSLISMIAALAVGQQSQSMGATEALRPPPAPAEASTPSSASDTTPQAETTAAASPRMICRSVPVTGSRFPIRQCRNAVQTEAERQEARDMLHRMQGARVPQPG